MAANAWTLAIIRNLDTQLKEHKCKYEQAQTELRIMTGKVPIFSSLRMIVTDLNCFLQAPIQYDQLPVSPDVGFGHPHNNLCIRYRQRSQ
jgi:hypothetical protein